jgi:hypothetical protein
MQITILFGFSNAANFKGSEIHEWAYKYDSVDFRIENNKVTFGIFLEKGAYFQDTGLAKQKHC